MACFPSPSFGGFGYIAAVTKYSRKLSDCLRVNLIWLFQATGNVRFGSLADVFTNHRPMSASERKADVQHTNFDSEILNVRFSQYRTFRPPKNHEIEGPLPAISGRSFERIFNFCNYFSRRRNCSFEFTSQMRLVVVSRIHQVPKSLIGKHAIDCSRISR